ncbi:DUF1353 domain-containing protein [Campylobacter sputorum]|uniref:DUF1353 domain-containing protein n=1 Tax=Campylobacter sputorum TaxID=206 RepID=UPI00053BFF64|nr:DUF1353 domain-containing protein [Campylobacter sputorum]
MEISRPILKPFDKDKFELVEDYKLNIDKIYLRGTNVDNLQINIAKGYKTNGADIPRIFWWLFPPNSPEYLSAIITHDYLTDEALNKYQADKKYGKYFFKLSDIVLKEMMRELGIAKWKVWCFYYACRAYHKLRYMQ